MGETSCRTAIDDCPRCLHDMSMPKQRPWDMLWILIAFPRRAVSACQLS